MTTTTRSQPVGLPQMPADLERETPRKVARRLLPFLLLLYIACYLDRVNVGFAALQMNQALGLSAAAYGLGAGVFFIGYCLFEVPSNIVLARAGARRWIARILISWGLISSAMMFVRGPASFYTLRFLLGAAEAGFFPGIIYYLGEWFPSYERAKVIARFMVAIPLSGVVGGPLSGTLLGLGGHAGLAGWQWLFLLEGIPSVVLGLVALVYLTDRPEVARWLAPEERAWLTDRLRMDRERSVERDHVSVGQALSHPMVWRLALQQGLTLAAGLYALSFWLPQIVKEFSGLGDMGVGLVTAVPYLSGAVAMVVVGAHSDHSGERWLHIAAGSLAAAIGFAASALVHTPVLALAALSVATAGVMSAMGPFWALPGTFLSGAAAAAGIALINSLASVMGFATPYALGLVKDAGGGYNVGLVLLAMLPLAGAVLALRLRRAPLFMRGSPPLASPVTP